PDDPYAWGGGILNEVHRFDARRQQQRLTGVGEGELLVVDDRVRAFGDKGWRVRVSRGTWKLHASAEMFIKPKHFARCWIHPQASARAAERIDPAALAVPPDFRRLGPPCLVLDAPRADAVDRFEPSDGEAELVTVGSEKKRQWSER